MVCIYYVCNVYNHRETEEETTAGRETQEETTAGRETQEETTAERETEEETTAGMETEEDVTSERAPGEIPRRLPCFPKTDFDLENKLHIGSGGFGVVFLVRQISRNRMVVVKIPNHDMQ